jgi:hypothetical protein
MRSVNVCDRLINTATLPGGKCSRTHTVIARFARSLWNLGTRNQLITGPSSNPREYHFQVVPPALLSLVRAPRHVA